MSGGIRVDVVSCTQRPQGGKPPRGGGTLRFGYGGLNETAVLGVGGGGGEGGEWMDREDAVQSSRLANKFSSCCRPAPSLSLAPDCNAQSAKAMSSPVVDTLQRRRQDTGTQHWAAAKEAAVSRHTAAMAAAAAAYSPVLLLQNMLSGAERLGPLIIVRFDVLKNKLQQLKVP